MNIPFFKISITVFFILIFGFVGFGYLLYDHMFGYDPKSGFAKEYQHQRLLSLAVHREELPELESDLLKFAKKKEMMVKSGAMNNFNGDGGISIFIYENLLKGYAKVDSYSATLEPDSVRIMFKWNANSFGEFVEEVQIYLRSLEIEYRVAERVESNRFVFRKEESMVSE